MALPLEGFEFAVDEAEEPELKGLRLSLKAAEGTVGGLISTNSEEGELALEDRCAEATALPHPAAPMEQAAGGWSERRSSLRRT